MSKMNLQDLQSLFTVAKIKGNSRISKHRNGKIRLTEEQIRKAKAAKRNK